MRARLCVAYALNRVLISVCEIIYISFSIGIMFETRPTVNTKYVTLESLKVIFFFLLLLLI